MKSQQERVLSMDDQIDEWRARETNLGVALVFSACKLLQSQVRVMGRTSHPAMHASGRP